MAGSPRKSFSKEPFFLGTHVLKWVFKGFVWDPLIDLKGWGGGSAPPAPPLAFAPLARTPLVTQEDPLALLPLPGLPGLPSGSSLGSLELLQATLR